MLSIECKNVLIPFVVACATLLSVLPCAKADDEMPPDEVWALLPKGVDAEDDNEIANYMKLVGQGEAVYDMLLDIVRGTTDPIITSSALSVIRASKGDKKKVVAELGVLLNERKSMSGDTNEAMLVDLVRAIADMGEASDRQLLEPILEHSGGYVRWACNSGMEKLAAKAVHTDNPPTAEPTGQLVDEDGSEEGANILADSHAEQANP